MWSELINLNIIRTDFCVLCLYSSLTHPTHRLCLCHLTLGSGRAGAAEVQPSHGCCLDDIITHTFIFILSHTHSPSCKTWTNTALMFLRIETLLSLDFSYQIQFNVFYTVWQVSCHTSVMLIIHTCLIITDTIGINQRIVTIINEWSNIWRHYHLTLTVSAVSWLTLGAHWPGVIPRLCALCRDTRPGGGRGQACLLCQEAVFI